MVFLDLERLGLRYCINFICGFLAFLRIRLGFIYFWDLFVTNFLEVLDQVLSYTILYLYKALRVTFKHLEVTDNSLSIVSLFVRILIKLMPPGSTLYPIDNRRKRRVKDKAIKFS
jgi:hypothetical protein